MERTRTLSEHGGLRNGRAVLRAADLLLSLITLCGDPSRFAALNAALRDTLRAAPQHPTS